MISRLVVRLPHYKVRRKTVNMPDAHVDRRHVGRGKKKRSLV